MIRILLADDHALVRQGFSMMLAAQPDMQVVGQAANGREAVELATKLLPDVAILDVTMPELNGIEATRRLAESTPRTRVLALSMHKDAVYVREILRAGARGYLLKDSSDADLLAAVRAVAKGEGYISPGVSEAVLSDYRRHVTDPLDLLSDYAQSERVHGGGASRTPDGEIEPAQHWGVGAFRAAQGVDRLIVEQALACNGDFSPRVDAEAKASVAG
jgi:DNA-binding NarL/FixJ family response regulator